MYYFNINMPSVIRHSSQVQKINSPLFKNIAKCEHDAYKTKQISSWNTSDTLAWIAKTMNKKQIDVEDVNMPDFRVKGQELLKMTEMDFSRIDYQYGQYIFSQFEIYKYENKDNIYAPEPPKEKENILDKPIRRPPGRPRSAVPKKKREKNGRLWEFIRDLLLNPKTCPSLVKWNDYDNRKFQFVDSKQVADMWGRRKNNDEMNYEKFSRAMRYYYKTGILKPVEGQRLVYSFGPNASGWETDDPNFRKSSKSEDVKECSKYIN